jgi:uncharacterized protein with FMN-binding domain
MKRAPLFVVTGAIAGFAGVLAFHTGTAAPAAAAPGAAATGPAGGSATTKPSTGSSPAAHKSGGTGGTAASGAARTATGSSVNFGYGSIAVKVTVRGTRVISASVASIQVLEPTSQQISAQAIPMLRSEVMSAGNARINGISGATYTSQGYAQSVQSALDKLHA